MYALVVWVPRLPSFMWSQVKRQFVIMLSKQIRSESTIPHKIITTEFTLPPMLVEAHFQLVIFINRPYSQSQVRISGQAFEAV